MQAEPSVCDPFDVEAAPLREQFPSMHMVESPSSSGLDLTGASISSATGEDGELSVREPRRLLYNVT